MKLAESYQRKNHIHLGYFRTQQWGYKYVKALKPRSTRIIQFEPENCRYKNEIIPCGSSKVFIKDAYMYVIISE